MAFSIEGSAARAIAAQADAATAFENLAIQCEELNGKLMKLSSLIDSFDRSGQMLTFDDDEQDE